MSEVLNAFPPAVSNNSAEVTARQRLQIYAAALCCAFAGPLGAQSSYSTDLVTGKKPQFGVCSTQRDKRSEHPSVGLFAGFRTAGVHSGSRVL